MNKDDLLNIFEARVFHYTLFQSIFGNEPTREQLEIACSETTLASLDPLAKGRSQSFNQAKDKLVLVLREYCDASTEKVTKLRDEYTKLFIGPGELQAGPWESLYVSNKKQIFDENTLAVRNFYRVNGFLPVEYPRVADDHLALECAFMAKIGQRVLEATDNEKVKQAIQVSRQFLNEHLLVWMPVYFDKLREDGYSNFFSAMVEFALEYMKADAEFLAREIV